MSDPARHRIQVRAQVAVARRAQDVFTAVTDWAGQGRWMPATQVQHIGGPSAGIGTYLAATTGFGRVSFVDTMRVIDWDPPRSCQVRHTGAVVRGTARFLVEPVGDQAAILTWSEDLRLPLAWLLGLVRGPITWLSGAALTWALRRLARQLG